MLAAALTLAALSVALAADAFAAAVCQGAAASPRATAGRALKIGLAFGSAQALMPLIGWGAGLAAAPLVREIDHWVAFVLLAGVGAKMLWDARGGAGGGPAPLLAGWALAAAALATSVDAAAAGVTLPLVGLPVAVSAAVIGAVTLVLSTVGVVAGSLAGTLVGRRATIAGGALLILLGIKILLEHTVFA